LVCRAINLKWLILYKAVISGLCLDKNLWFSPKDRLGFIKVDAEGYDLFVLQGAEKLLLDARPVVMVEQKRGVKNPYTDESATVYLEGLGMTQVAEAQIDKVFAWT